MEEIKIRDLRRIFGCGFRCNVGRIVGYVTGVTAGATAEKTSKARILISSKCLIKHIELSKTPDACHPVCTPGKILRKEDN